MKSSPQPNKLVAVIQAIELIVSVMSGIQDNMQQDDIEHVEPVFELTHNST